MTEITLIYIVSALQVLLAVVLVNVWIVRFSKPTRYRGAGAENMKDEFIKYGLPVWFMYVVGASKLIIALALLLGLWFPFLVLPATIFLSLLMLGAVAMHIKVKDPIVRTLPALTILVLSLLCVFIIYSM